MSSIFPSLFPTGALDQLFLVVVFCTLLLLALTLFFAIYTIHLRLAHMRKAQRWKRLEQIWEPALKKVLAGERSPFVAWKRVRPRDRRYFVDFLLRYADGLPGEDQQILVKTAGGFLIYVADHMKKVDPERYARSIHTLGLLGLETFSAAIIAALDDPSPLVNMVAARALLRNGRLDYVEAVLRRAKRFKDWSSGFLASMLVAAGPEAVPLLRQIFLDVARPTWLRASVADALVEQNDAAAADIAARVLQTETDRELVTAALRLLKRTGRPEHSAILRELCNSPDFVIRAHAVSALASLGNARDIQQLWRFFEDPSSWVAIHAAWALKERGGEEVLRELVACHHPRAKLALQVLSERLL
jgi:HEAT repeat protein